MQVTQFIAYFWNEVSDHVVKTHSQLAKRLDAQTIHSLVAPLCPTSHPSSENQRPPL